MKKKKMNNSSDCCGGGNVVLTGVASHCTVFCVNQVLCPCNFLSHLVGVEHLALDPFN